MTYHPVDAIEVRCWGQQVGAVARDPRSGYYAFEYAPAWRRTGVELAPLTMPLAGGPYVFPLLAPTTYQRLPAAIADSLPDSFGNALVDAALAQEGVSRDEITPLDRLAYLGRRGIGALEYRPERGPRNSTATAIEMSDLVTAARAALQGELGGDRETEAALRQLIAVGTSAGGQRAKAVIAWNRVTGAIRSGQVDDLPPGFEHWLLKFDGVGEDLELGVSRGYGRIEFAYSLMARAAGIEMSPCELLEESGRAHFLTRRFDRPGDAKVHVQTLCAMAQLDYNQIGTHGYEQYLLTVHQLALPAAARTEAFRRAVFNVAAMNRDDHTKNLGFTCTPDGTWALAPAYDVTFAHQPGGRWTQVHQMSVGGRFADITREDLLTMSDRFEVPAARDVLADVLAAVDRWPDFAAEAGVPEDEITRIAAEHAGVRPPLA